MVCVLVNHLGMLTTGSHLGQPGPVSINYVEQNQRANHYITSPP